MDASQEVREKLVLVLGNLLCRCIEEARKVPYILDPDDAVQILIENPQHFERLVLDEQLDRTEFSSENLTARLDTFEELEQFKSLDAWDMSFSGRLEAAADLSPIVDRVNQLSRTFSVYVSNMITIFEREFALFVEKFRRSLRLTGMPIRAIELTSDDMAGLATRAKSYLFAGQFVQAFSFDRLLNCHVIDKDALIVPYPGYSVSQELMRSTLKVAGLFRPLVKFILRLTYISQNTWHELFEMLLRLVDAQCDLQTRNALVELIQEDIIFACNLLHEPFADVQHWTPDQRRAAIEAKLAAVTLDEGRS